MLRSAEGNVEFLETSADPQPRPNHMQVSPILIPESKIFLVGEAPGKTEEAEGKPFVGASGQELDQMLEAAGIARSSCSISNVFLSRPPNNDLSAWQGSKAEGGIGEAVGKGKYFFPEYYKERERLWKEIAQVGPNVVVALGNTALWATTGNIGIMARRGTVQPFSAPARTMGAAGKVIATYHPAAVMRQYELRGVTIMDLMKAKVESEDKSIKVPKWRVRIAPTLENIYNSMEFFCSAYQTVAYDIETAYDQITCIGFAEGRYSITIPFVDETKPDKSYWPNPAQEVEAWKMTKMILESYSTKVTQNGLYDIQWLWRMGIRPRNSFHDTMLLHHSIQPEMPKSLGFLGSVYTSFPSWKGMRKTSTTKKDE